MLFFLDIVFDCTFQKKFVNFALKIVISIPVSKVPDNLITWLKFIMDSVLGVAILYYYEYNTWNS